MFYSLVKYCILLSIFLLSLKSRDPYLGDKPGSLCRIRILGSADINGDFLLPGSVLFLLFSFSRSFISNYSHDGCSRNSRTSCTVYRFHDLPFPKGSRFCDSESLCTIELSKRPCSVCYRAFSNFVCGSISFFVVVLYETK